MIRSAALFAITFFLFTAAIGQETADVPVAPVIPKTHPAQGVINQAANAFRAGNGNESLKLFVAAHAKHSDLPPGEIMFAHLAFAANQSKAGRSALEVAAINHPDDPELWNMFADLAVREKRFAESAILFDKALTLAKSLDDESARKVKQLINAHGGLALIHQQRKNWKQAESHLRAWIELDERNITPWQRLAMVFFATQRYETAKKTLDNMRTFAKQLPASDVTMGLMYQQVGKHDEASTSMQAAIQANPDDFATQLAAARWAMTAGNQELLQQCATKAKEIRPETAAVDALTGMAERFGGNPVKAESIFARMLDRNPASFDAKNGLALSLLEQDDTDKHRRALQHAQILVKSNTDQRTPRGRAAAATLAWALHRLGQDKNAESVIKNVITSGEISPEVGYFAATIFVATGQKPLAKQLLTAALQSHVAFPEQKAAEELLQTLTD